jgi:hypothetical protein
MKVRIPTKSGWLAVEVEWLDGAMGFVGKTDKDKNAMMGLNIVSFQHCDLPQSVKCFAGVFEVIE